MPVGITALAVAMITAAILGFISFREISADRARHAMADALMAQTSLLAELQVDVVEAFSASDERLPELRARIADGIARLRADHSAMEREAELLRDPSYLRFAEPLDSSQGARGALEKVIGVSSTVLTPDGDAEGGMAELAIQEANYTAVREYEAVHRALTASATLSIDRRAWMTAGVAVIFAVLSLLIFFLLFLPRSRRMAFEARQRAEEALLFQSVCEGAPGAMLAVNAAGRIVLANRETAAMFGFQKEELLNQPVKMLIPERHRIGEVVKRMTVAVEQPPNPTPTPAVQVTGLRRDGSEFPVDIRLSSIQTSDGLLALAAMRDLTATLAAEEEESARRRELETMVTVSGLIAEKGTVAEKVERALRRIVEVTDSSSATLRAADEFGRLNARWSTGEHEVKSLSEGPNAIRPQGVVERAYLTGRPEILHDYDEYEGARAELVQAGVRSVAAFPVVTSEGTVGVVVVTSKRPRFGSNNIKLMTAVTSSIGAVIEQARLLEAEQARSAELDALVRINNVIFGAAPFEERATEVLSILLEMHGADRGTVRVPREGEPGLEMVAKAGDVGATKAIQTSPDSISSEAFRTGETVIRNRVEFNGAPGSAISLPIKDTQGTIAVVTLGSRNVGHFKPNVVANMEAKMRTLGFALESQRLRAEIDLQHALAERRDSFVATASHELRTPMSTLVGLSELLLTSEPGPEKRHSWYEMMNRESNRLADIVSDMLDVTRIQAGNVQLELTPVRLREAVEAAVGPLRHACPDHDLVVEVADDLPPVLADRQRLVQVVVNLAVNAVKYSPDGGRVRISAHAGDQMVVDVEDEGLGIDEQDIPKLFEAFGRIRNSETANIRGTGLGLYITRNILQMMGGRIWVRSTPGKGSIFSFSLPLFEESSIETDFATGSAA